MRLLMIEDDRALSGATKVSLERAGYQVDQAYDGEDGLQFALMGTYDILIIDRMLPGLNGTDIVLKLRQRGIASPILLLTALDGIHDRVDGLDAGADDYLTKPFAIEELLARLRALGRRPADWQQEQTVQWHDMTLNPWHFELLGPEGKCTLSKHECALLEALLRSGERTLPRATLFSRVWGADADVDDANLDRYIHFLRRRLKTVGSGAALKTIYGVGYRLEVSSC